MVLRQSLVPFLIFILCAASAGASTLDSGRLDPAWYDDGEPVFKETKQIDYLWVRQGADLEGRSFQFAQWSEPEFLGPKAEERDDDDRRLARQMAGDMHNSFAEIWSELGFDASTSEGDILVEGRIVDCSTGNRAAKIIVGLGAGAGSTVTDVRFKDAATGEVLAGGFQRAYDRGDRQTDSSLSMRRRGRGRSGTSSSSPPWPSR